MSDGHRHQYRRRVDPAGDDSLAAIVRRIRPESRVLELGVATGYLSRYLREDLGCLVDGVEIDPGMAREAGKWCGRLLVANLEREPLGRHFPRGFYDFVIAADVLEHLVDPGSVLRQLPELLTAGGRLIVSLPNSAYAGLVLELFSGELRYRDEGLLDRTHLRFYTAISARRLLRGHGYTVEEVEPVRLPYEDSEFRALFGTLDADLVERVQARSDADAYQYVLTAAPTGDLHDTKEPALDVVVPVYRGARATRRCLESVLGFTQATPHEIVVIDDATPEPEIAAWLDTLAAAGRITLLRNPVNRGFTSCANLGMSLHPERDLVLLNSDTEVHGDWLDRLYRAARESDDVGSVTPLTNNGTIAAYPQFCEDNPMPDGAGLAVLDTLCARVNAGRRLELPTAVGFCMLITRRCIDAVGYFDQGNFPRGYGEENDFSLRAIEQGFRNLLCADVYVAHQGGVSFADERQALYEQGAQRLAELYPGYLQAVAEHATADPARIPRRHLDLARLAASPRPRILMISHGIGGGTERYLRDLAQVLEGRAEVLALRTDPASGATAVTLEWMRRGEALRLYLELPSALDGLLRLCRELGVARVHIHHLLGHHRTVWELAQRLEVPYDFTLHDYYPVCPQFNLTTLDGRYCGEPDSDGCNACLRGRPAPWGTDIAAWRDAFANLLRGAARVMGPSADVLERMARYIPDLPYLLLPHVELPVRKVLVLGTMHLAKGAALLEAAARHAREQELPLYFRVLGAPDLRTKEGEDLPYRTGASGLPLSYAGAYTEWELAELIRREQADVIYFPAQWPETYSYTLSAALDAGLPILAPDLGAFPERLADHPGARLLPWDSPVEAVNEALLALAGEPGTAPGQTPEEYLIRYLDGLELPLPETPERPGAWLPAQRFYRRPRVFSDIALRPLEVVQRVRQHLQLAADRPLTRNRLEQLLRCAEPEHKERQIVALTAELAERETQIEEHNQELTDLYGSRSWRLTRPLRAVRTGYLRGLALLRLLRAFAAQRGAAALPGLLRPAWRALRDHGPSGLRAFLAQLHEELLTGRD